jgi:hypothetical protein
MVRFFWGVWIVLFLVACGSGGSQRSGSLSEESEQNSTQGSLSIRNTAPIAKEESLSTQEETSVEITLHGSDKEEDNLSFSILRKPLHGQLRGEAPNLIYHPNLNYYGQDSFAFGVNDGELSSKEAEITIEITPVNDRPIAEALQLYLPQDSNRSFTLSAYDIDSYDLNYTIERSPAHGQLSGIAPELLYTPDENYVGEDHFSFSVSDGQLSSTIKDVNLTIIPSQEIKVSISGRITYDLVPSKPTHDGLDYTNIRQESIKGAVVELLDSSDQLLQSTISDANGTYLFSDLPSQTEVKVRVYAKMQKHDGSSWDVKVVDNTHANALYGFEGELISTGKKDAIRNLNASSGWGGGGYTSSRIAAPFAIMDVIYRSMKNIEAVDANISFPPLVVNWSVDNVPQNGSLADGQIGTSHYQNGNLYILGDANSDTDEYDDHVIAHEWGHYYEDKFSRTDSIGGMHTNGDYLDIRVAFGEGFGNAISAISLRDPIYFDTLGVAQSQGWSMNMEQEVTTHAGWFSEFSVQHILYDLFDNSNEEEDNLSLGFAPLHHVFVGKQKQTPAFTSIFSFIDALKRENNESATQIDQIVAKEGIGSITDAYGRGRIILPSEEPYSDLVVGTTLNICTTNRYGNLGSRNKLSNHKYITFTLAESGEYILRVKRNNGTGSDPDFFLSKTSPDFTFIGTAESPLGDIEEIKTPLEGGDYLLDISDWNTKEDACFDVSVERS